MPNTILPLFNIGPTIVGRVLGSPYAQYRPVGTGNPIVAGNLLGNINAWITDDPDGKANRSAGYGKPLRYGFFDPTVTQPGDYLVGPMGTLFIATQSVPSPMQLVLCNRQATLTRPNGMATVGLQPAYGGDQRATEIVLATSWPCAILQGTKGDMGASRLPGDVKMPWHNVMLPAMSGVAVRNNLILTDDLGFRHIVSSTEQSVLGWRLTCVLATT